MKTKPIYCDDYAEGVARAHHRDTERFKSAVDETFKNVGKAFVDAVAAMEKSLPLCYGDYSVNNPECECCHYACPCREECVESGGER